MHGSCAAEALRSNGTGDHHIHGHREGKDTRHDKGAVGNGLMKRRSILVWISSSIPLHTAGVSLHRHLLVIFSIVLAHHYPYSTKT